MNIKNLSSEKGFANATISLDYEEIRCICNSLFTLSTVENVEQESNFDKVRADFVALFALVKHGMIPEFESAIIYKLLCKQDSQNKKGGEQGG